MQLIYNLLLFFSTRKMSQSRRSYGAVGAYRDNPEDDSYYDRGRNRGFQTPGIRDTREINILKFLHSQNIGT